jgi:adenine-specific DNA-methyltransferase
MEDESNFNNPIEKILKDTQKWRATLNTAISDQLIILFIFLRFAEDSGLEEFGTLKKIITNYNNLCEIGNKYSSELFNFTISDFCHIQNEIINDVVNELYNGIYLSFNKIPIYVLGSVYENFLNTTSKQSKGIYYTPEYPLCITKDFVFVSVVLEIF